MTAEIQKIGVNVNIPIYTKRADIESAPIKLMFLKMSLREQAPPHIWLKNIGACHPKSVTRTYRTTQITPATGKSVRKRVAGRVRRVGSVISGGGSESAA